MYLPEVFEEVRPEILWDLLARRPLGLLVTAGPEGPMASPLPFLRREADGRPGLAAHLARANPHLAAQWAAELDGVCKRAEPYLDPTALSSARHQAMELLDVGTLDLVPAHRSNHPAHWLIHPQRGVHLVGFSRSEYDPWIVDAAALHRDYWGYSPELQRAFFSGYDRTPDEVDLLIR